MTDPFVKDTKDRLTDLEHQRVRYVQGTVTAVDTVGNTYAADVGGQADGRTVSLDGILGRPPFLPNVGDQVLLALTGAQPVHDKTLNPDATLTGAIQTKNTGQRVRMDDTGHTFYPAGAGLPATIYSIDDGSGNAGISAVAGGTTVGGLNFTSTFADLGWASSSTTSFASFVRCSADPVHSVHIGVAAGTGMAFTFDTAMDLFGPGGGQFAQLGSDNTLHGIVKFSTDLSPATSFTFGTAAGATNADVYALRFISTNPGGTGGFVYFSDERLKTDIVTADFDALDEILNTPIRQFQWIETGQTDVGFVAQEAPADAQVQLSPDRPIYGIANPVGLSPERITVKLWKAAQESAAIFLALKAWHDNVMNNEVRSVETRVALPALTSLAPQADLAVSWPSAPLAITPDTATVCQEFPGALVGRVGTRVLPGSITPSGCTVRCNLLSGADIAAAAGQLHVTALAWA